MHRVAVPRHMDAALRRRLYAIVGLLTALVVIGGALVLRFDATGDIVVSLLIGVVVGLVISGGELFDG